MKVVIPNAIELIGSAAKVVPPDIGNDLFSITEVAAVETGSTRSGGQGRHLDLNENELIEVTLEDGSRWYLGPDERAELLATQPSARGAQADELVLGGLVFSDGSSRGIASNVIKRVKVFTLDLLLSLGDNAIDLAAEQLSSTVQDNLGSLIIDPVAYTIARRLEKNLATQGTSRICRVVVNDQSDVQLEPIDADALAEIVSEDEPTLLLLHGTLSSTEGSFGELWRTRLDDFKILQRYYDKRIVALEHCTLTESPISNALLVAEALPLKSRLHILSHSRGGLVGELLCRGTRVTKSAFSPEEIALFDAQQKAGKRELDLSRIVFDALRNHYKTELENLQALNHRLSELSLVIDRFVRVACPARGTTLASGKLHRWSNRAFNAVGILGGQSLNPVYNAFQTFSLSVLKSNTKAEVLPGLQAQMPDSALIHVLNNSNDEVPADLSVLAGDIEIANRFNWKNIPLWLTDRFYGGANDLVVNTASMDGGASRETGMVALQVVGDHVNHFSYFSNPDSASQLVKRLTGVDSPRFARYTRPADVYIPRSAPPQLTGDRPVLLLVPGVMGSELEIDGEKIWLNVPSLLKGNLRHLSIDNQPPEISTSGVMEKSYGQFIQSMSRTHDVFVCPYDWRCSLTDSAAVLASRVKELLALQESASERLPIRIVAHSTGGLVTRMMIARHPDVWEQIVSRSGSRFLMAGTPTNGTYLVNRIVSGEDRLIKLLSLIDMQNSRTYITKLVSEFPGFATLLPGFGTLEWLQPATWNEIGRSGSSKHWSLVNEELLTLARRERQLLLDTPLNPELVGYVAGQADKTAADAFLDEAHGNEVRFRYTREGDGQVTWKNGIPSGLPNVWYQPTGHGGLLAEPAYFDAWEQLLKNGHTSLLPQSPPGKRSFGSDEPEFWTEEADTEVIDYLPDNDALQALALGIEPVRTGAKVSAAPRLKVEISHGDLSFSRFPVAVGHYEGDSILHAESALDRELDFRLSERQAIGQYPGEIGTSEVLFARSDRPIPEGALIIGLGQLGELSAATLERTVTQGLINYIFEFNEWWSGQDRGQKAPVVGLSALLIGSGIGVLTVRDTVGALLRSVSAANRLFEEKQINHFRLLEHLEIVELWQDLALEAIDMALEWSRDMPQVAVEPELRVLDGGRQRSRFQGSPDWWHTINVKLSDDKSEYVYDDYTRFARNELTREPMDRHFVDMFLEQIIHSPRYDRNAASSPQQALFQLLLPRTIKEKSPDSDKLLLILDESTARIPWEMLTDGWSAKKEPLAVSKTIIRRLSLENFRHRPEPALGNQALVVGDPPSGSDPYQPLRGARDEARAVARLLQINRQYEVTSCIADDSTNQYSPDMALQIIEALYSQEFRILHFAGHGSYYRETTAGSRDPHDEGMVIGEGLRLTPTLISKMPRTPTLVFLNCCHLGYIEERTDDTRVRYNHIAANLATQFLKLGSRVVIAAGWEVDDAAAKRFAEVFYDNLLANRKLSEAVNEARSITYRQFPDTNTFGAYQCWGDPEFRLDPRRGAARLGNSENRFVSAYECELAAVNIRNAAKSAKAGYLEKLEQQTDELLKELIRKYGDPWMSPDVRHITGKVWNRSRTRALSRLGRAYGELGRLDMAVKLLRAANRLNPASLSVYDLEQLGNFECRCAAQIHCTLQEAKAHPLPELGSAKSVFNSGKRRLKRLLDDYSRIGQHMVLSDIHCLLGGAAKRQAMLQDEGGKADVNAIGNALNEMRYHFGTGWAGGAATESQSVDEYIRQAAINQEPPEQYAFVNFALAVITARWFENGEQSVLSAAFIDQVKRLTLNARQTMRREESFWEAVAPADAILLQFLDDSVCRAVGVFDEKIDLGEEIKTIYTNTSRRFGSERQWASIYDHLHFVKKMLDKKPDTAKESKEADTGKIEVLNALKGYVLGLSKSET